jgi:hypothetical protein
MWLIISILVTLASLFGFGGHHATSAPRAHVQARQDIQARQDVHSLFFARSDSGSGPVGSARP